MKHSKKALKSIFGSQSEGLRYMEAVLSNEKSPVLFAKGPGADDFADWMSHFMSNHALLDHDTFNQSHAARNEPLLIVKGVDEIHDGTVQAAVAARDGMKNVVIASKKHPKILDYVSDPAFKIIHVEKLDLGALKAEIGDLIDVVN